jgi:hypothetical protein
MLGVACLFVAVGLIEIAYRTFGRDGIVMGDYIAANFLCVCSPTGGNWRTNSDRLADWQTRWPFGRMPWMKVKIGANSLKGHEAFRPNIDPVFMYDGAPLLGRQGASRFRASVAAKW